MVTFSQTLCLSMRLFGGLTLIFLLYNSLAQPVKNPTGYDIADQILSTSVNLSADPCDDFYNYACGNWVKNAKLQYGRTSRNAMHDTTHDIAKDMIVLLNDTVDSGSKTINGLKLAFQKCMSSENRLQLFLNQVEELGGWPILGGNWTKEFDLSKMMQALRNDFLFQISLQGRDKNNDYYHALNLVSADLDLNNRIYSSPDTHQAQIAAHKAYMKEKISLVKSDFLGKDVSVSDAEIEEIFNLESTIVGARNERPEYISFFDFIKNKKYEEFKWEEYFRTGTTKKVFETLMASKVYVQVAYMEALQRILDSTDKRILQNYAIWRLLRQKFLQNYQLDECYVDVGEIYSAMSKNNRIAKQPRDMACASTLTWFKDTPIFAIGALYGKAHITDEIREEVREMMKNLRSEMIKIVESKSWMKNETKKVAIEKINSIQYNFLYPDWVMNNTALDEYYQNLDFVITEEDTYTSIIAKIEALALREQYEWLLSPFKRENFRFAATFANAANGHAKNSIELPGGLFRPPYFRVDFPSFDNEGRRRSWWDAETEHEFNKRTECIREQYSNFTIPGTGLRVNADKTLGENIADNGGLKVAFNAYKSWLQRTFGDGEEPRIRGLHNLTNEQTFFVSYARQYCNIDTVADRIERRDYDAHAPDTFRVTGLMMNSNEFAKAFKCPIGTKMNPVNKCEVW
ncbi:hypothetical protein QR680_010398 [Steinernema hermaphroditum]|uniref:Uncharacterized protein n=1 Tax=Steinernema hermaphroditum TaxID=289476 RepID=A0AA39IRA2_9BILA|nr:hypothetical protein QR680_010398 [Steinernema hermaphroditum]